jgi:hypothetical protein
MLSHDAVKIGFAVDLCAVNDDGFYRFHVFSLM